MKNPNVIMTKSEMKKFNNPLTLDQNGNQQDQNYVLSPLNGLQYIIHCDGSLFCYLLQQSKKDQKEYIEKFPFLSEWSASGWANWCLCCQLRTYTYYAWIPPFYLVNKNWGPEGYKMGDPTVDPDVDIDECYHGHSQEWSDQMAEIVWHPVAVPDGPAKDYLYSIGDNGFAFIIYGDLHFNPNLLKVPQQLIPKHPSQDGLSVAQYHNKVDYYYWMCAFIEDSQESYDEESTQNKYSQHG